MKKLKLIVGLVVFAMTIGSASAGEFVSGYTKKNGTYVQGYMRSSPNSYKFDNYSSKGNRNPYTGKRGYRQNEFTSPSLQGRGRRTFKSGIQW